jgi:hypothetical protein
MMAIFFDQQLVDDQYSAPEVVSLRLVGPGSAQGV